MALFYLLFLLGFIKYYPIKMLSNGIPTNKIKITGIDNKFVNHGKVNDLKQNINLDIDYIVKDIIKYFNDK